MLSWQNIFPKRYRQCL